MFENLNYQVRILFYIQRFRIVALRISISNCFYQLVNYIVTRTYQELQKVSNRA